MASYWYWNNYSNQTTKKTGFIGTLPQIAYLISRITNCLCIFPPIPDAGIFLFPVFSPALHVFHVLVRVLVFNTNYLQSMKVYHRIICWGWPRIALDLYG